ncbi:hypothetical protein CCHR01_19367 [Colletotrichum chrysophilum]|uniref:Uncharacterized protein n=1 Tax=Colletotrichum chrysophilum TaxID=1836956 RepID=A0AAD8ZYR4_9PEZI|nr:hypothetical protein CCHR01_19367 [Colletotrichum chrysophilum]
MDTTLVLMRSPPPPQHHGRRNSTVRSSSTPSILQKPGRLLVMTTTTTTVAVAIAANDPFFSRPIIPPCPIPPPVHTLHPSLSHPHTKLSRPLVSFSPLPCRANITNAHPLPMQTELSLSRARHGILVRRNP